MVRDQDGTGERDRLDAILARHAAREGPLLPVLHDVQHAFGRIPRALVPQIAEALNISAAEVHGVVTFYSDFRYEADGAHLLQVCRAEACQAMGGEALADRAEQSLGLGFDQVSADGAVALRTVYCFGNCALAPSVALDGTLCGRMTTARLDALLARIVP
ncbi:formate dehydrogenase subunit gamma [Zavarzinia sp. CC-PAN008]|uniref:formate dehydrogenase subunit gamma n=1 Tax=Zavarzinia sp. CC-PAN008 TaxID=3243332 RepID=UPI003F7480F8